MTSSPGPTSTASRRRRAGGRTTNLDSWLTGALALFLVAGLSLIFIRDRLTQAVTPTLVPVAREAVPAYHRLLPDDLEMKAFPPDQIPLDALRDPDRLGIAVTSAPLAAGEPIRTTDLISLPSEDLIQDREIVAITVWPMHAFGGNLGAGQQVTLWDDTIEVGVFLVLDVQQAASPGQYDYYIVILAVPQDQREAVLRAARAGHVALTSPLS